jgi:uncharacterized protein YceK
MYSRRSILALLTGVLAGSLLTLNGCMSALTRFELAMKDKRPEVYPTVQAFARTSAAREPDWPSSPIPPSPQTALLAIGVTALFALDVPLSIATDTVCLPGDIADQVRFDREKTATAR